MLYLYLEYSLMNYVLFQYFSCMWIWLYMEYASMKDKSMYLVELSINLSMLREDKNIWDRLC